MSGSSKSEPEFGFDHEDVPLVSIPCVKKLDFSVEKAIYGSSATAKGAEAIVLTLKGLQELTQAQVAAMHVAEKNAAHRTQFLADKQEQAAKTVADALDRHGTSNEKVAKRLLLATVVIAIGTLILACSSVVA